MRYKAVISDLSRTLLFPIDGYYTGGLNALHEKLIEQQGEYDFWSYFRLQPKLFAFYYKLSEKVEMYIFTTKFIQEYPPLAAKLDPVFKRVFSAHRLGFQNKSSQKAYKVIADKIGLDPTEILFIDDKQANLDAASATGMKTIKFETEAQTINEISIAMGLVRSQS